MRPPEFVTVAALVVLAVCGSDLVTFATSAGIGACSETIVFGDGGNPFTAHSCPAVRDCRVQRCQCLGASDTTDAETCLETASTPTCTEIGTCQVGFIECITAVSKMYYLEPNASCHAFAFNFHTAELSALLSGYINSTLSKGCKANTCELVRNLSLAATCDPTGDTCTGVLNGSATTTAAFSSTSSSVAPTTVATTDAATTTSSVPATPFFSTFQPLASAAATTPFWAAFLAAAVSAGFGASLKFTGW